MTETNACSKAVNKLLCVRICQNNKERILRFSSVEEEAVRGLFCFRKISELGLERSKVNRIARKPVRSKGCFMMQQKFLRVEKMRTDMRRRVKELALMSNDKAFREILVAASGKRTSGDVTILNVYEDLSAE